GRMVRDERAGTVAIVEEKDATPEQKTIDEINSGIYAFRYPVLERVLGKLTTRNAQGEYYLTDTLSLIQAEGERASVMCADDYRELLGINTPQQLAEAERLYLERGDRPGRRD